MRRPGTWETHLGDLGGDTPGGPTWEAYLGDPPGGHTPGVHIWGDTPGGHTWGCQDQQKCQIHTHMVLSSRQQVLSKCVGKRRK